MHFHGNRTTFKSPGRHPRPGGYRRVRSGECRFGLILSETGTEIPPLAGAANAASERALPVKVCRQIWEALGAQQPNLQQVLTKTAYDGRKSAFIPKQFPFGEGSETFTVTLPAHNVRDVPDARPREFKVKVSRLFPISQRLNNTDVLLFKTCRLIMLRMLI